MNRTLAAMACLLACLAWGSAAQGQTCTKQADGSYRCTEEALQLLGKRALRFEAEAKKADAKLVACKQSREVDAKVWAADLDGQRELAKTMARKRADAEEALEAWRQYAPWAAVGAFVLGGVAVAAVR